MQPETYIAGVNREELLTRLMSHCDPGSKAHEQIKMAIISRSADSITSAMEALTTAMITHATANDKLSRKVYALNIILVIATAVYALATVVYYFSPILPRQERIPASPPSRELQE